MKEHKWSRRAIVLAATVAIVASTSGFALASFLAPPTTLSTSASYYNGAVVQVPGFVSSALALSSTPNGVASCSPAQNNPANPLVDSTGSSVATLVLSANTDLKPGPYTNCHTGDFAIEFSFDYLVASSGVHTYNFTVYTLWANNNTTEQTNYGQIELGSSSPGAFGATVQVFVDYGMILPPQVYNVELLVHSL